MPIKQQSTHRVRAFKPICLEKQQRRSSSGGDGGAEAPAALSEPADISKAKSIEKVTVDDSSQMTSKSSSDTVEVFDFGDIVGKLERSNTGGNIKSGDLTTSMEISLRSLEMQLDDSLDLLGGEAGMIRLQSLDYDKETLMPDSAATADAVLNAEESSEDPPKESMEEPPTASNQKPSSEQGMPAVICPVVMMTARLERVSTGESIVPLGEKFRISSKDWVKDYEGESMGSINPSMITDATSNVAVTLKTEQHTTSDETSSQQGTPEIIANLSARERVNTTCESIVPLGEKFRIPSSEWVKDFEGEPDDPGPADPCMFDTKSGSISPVPKSLIVDTVPTTPPTKFAPKTNTSPTSSSTTPTKKKKRKARVLDGTRVVEPTDDDVKFGKGGGTNTHPGNRRFRNYARHLWPAYKHATKTERQNIANVLVESVKNEGHRFVERGEDKQWHEVIFGYHTKASQALRDVPKYFNVD